MKIQPADTVTVILHSPREKLLGLLHEIDQAGIYFRGIDLNYFDDWCRSIINNEPYLPMSEYFLPLWRVERVVRDESSNDMPSMAVQFEQRTGKSLVEF